MAATDQNVADRTLLIELLQEAGEIGLSYFKSANKVRYKSGNSPVSQADEEIDTFLRQSFRDARPDYGWLSEETEDNADRLSRERLVIADPIDGTRGFIDGRDEWCISVAIVENSRPVVAALHCPALGETFITDISETVTTIGTESTNKSADAKHRVTGSKKLIEVINAQTNSPFEATPFIPSLAYRLAMVSCGRLDGAFARPGASEWDVAAADLLLEKAGCVLSDPSGNPIRYNQSNVKLPGLVAASVGLHGELLSHANSTGIFQ